MDVVAFVRDKKKLERILYEEEDLVMRNLVETGNGGMKNDDEGGKKKRNGAPVVRVFRRNVARWSSDLTHLYYLNYLSTKDFGGDREGTSEEALRELFEEEEEEQSFLRK